MSVFHADRRFEQFEDITPEILKQEKVKLLLCDLDNTLRLHSEKEPAESVRPEEEPLPTIDTYFINYNKEIFEVTDKNILQRIRPERKKEFKAFTRSAEIISRNEASVLKIWDTFFVNY